MIDRDTDEELQKELIPASTALPPWWASGTKDDLLPSDHPLCSPEASLTPPPPQKGLNPPQEAAPAQLQKPLIPAITSSLKQEMTGLC